MSALRHRPELDGIRSIAVYLVLCFHAGMVTLEGGFIGVDLFFVLSGFLVTAVILHEVDQRGTLDLGGFYARRVRRLLPAAVVVIVVTGAFQVLVASLPARLAFVNDARASLLYYANWHFIGETRDYFATDTDSSPFLHFWSLAIEEQFYIVFPLVVVLVLRFGQRPLRLLAVVLTTATVCSVVLQLWHARSDASYAYYATETRMYQLTVGALLTLVVHRANARGRRSPLGNAATPVALLGLVVLAFTATRWFDVTPSTRGLMATVASGALILGVWYSSEGPLSRLLARPTPSYLGRISYGTYLWHWPVLLVLQQVFDVRPLVITVLGAAIATGLAGLSFTLLEHPIRRAPALVRRRWSTVAAGLTASAVAALVLVPPVLEIDRRPHLAVAAGEAVPSNSAPDLDRPVPRDLGLAAAAQDLGPSVEMCTRQDVEACRIVEGKGDHVLLLGDSQARMYIPAFTELARERSWTFSANVVAGCPWQAGQVNLRDSEDDKATCRQARESFFRDVLPAMEVDVVIAVGMARSEEYWEERLAAPDGRDESLAQLQVRTTRETADLITAAGPDLVIAASTYGTNGYQLHGFDPIECLATARLLSDCAVIPPRRQPAVEGAYAVLAAEMPAVNRVDFNAVICPSRKLCSPVLDGTVVWRDSNHVTTEILTKRRSQLYDRLRSTGAFDTS